ncbi:TetR/AcrR family transcriptional regulator [Streptomyces sp. Tue6028]|uniref:TetR/AcrR family transcriptional regulator n=1 Tax=Streptomyces sp. Tue6028 TaxID=2036037 RepID=UPI003D71DBA2
MGRVSQAQAQENRQRVVATAARLFREKGTSISVADVMQAAGLTHGGFYKQFASKDALVGEATAQAFAELEGRRAQAAGDEHGGQRDAARQALIDWYLSAGHRDDAADGCPSAGLAVDMARDAADSAAHRLYTDGVRDFAEWLAEGEEEGLVRLSTMVGALLLARATHGSPLSDRLLHAAHEALSVSG